MSSHPDERVKPKCSYPECKKQALFGINLDKQSCEGLYSCKEHLELMMRAGTVYHVWLLKN